MDVVLLQCRNYNKPAGQNPCELVWWVVVVLFLVLVCCVAVCCGVGLQDVLLTTYY